MSSARSRVRWLTFRTNANMFRKMVSLSRIATREVASRGQDVADDVQKETRGFGDMRMHVGSFFLSWWPLIPADAMTSRLIRSYNLIGVITLCYEGERRRGLWTYLLRASSVFSDSIWRTIGKFSSKICRFPYNCQPIKSFDSDITRHGRKFPTF